MFSRKGVTPIPPQAGQESVWDYPRPPRLEAVSKQLEIFFNGVKIANTNNAYRVLETSHPPVYYLPPNDIQMQYLHKVSGSSYCEWKGEAGYYDLVVNGKTAPRVAWYYPKPTPPFKAIKDHLAFYAAPMDCCLVRGEKVTPQPGNFYGGWITTNIVGPFKGDPHTMGW